MFFIDFKNIWKLKAQVLIKYLNRDRFLIVMQYIQENKTLYGTFFKYRNLLTDICLMGLAVALLALFANIRIPLWPVPITMQTFGVFLIAFFFGSKRGFTTILLYILTGLVGFGVFAGYKSGIATTLGPTGGYIIGFLAMAYFVGLMIEKGYGRTKKSILLCMIIGTAILYIFGLTGLWIYMGNIGLLKLLSYGFFPFIIGDSIKIAMAIGLFPYLWKAGEKYSLKKLYRKAIIDHYENLLQ